MAAEKKKSKKKLNETIETNPTPPSVDPDTVFQTFSSMGFGAYSTMSLSMEAQEFLEKIRKECSLGAMALEVINLDTDNIYCIQNKETPSQVFIILFEESLKTDPVELVGTPETNYSNINFFNARQAVASKIANPEILGSLIIEKASYAAYKSCFEFINRIFKAANDPVIHNFDIGLLANTSALSIDGSFDSVSRFIEAFTFGRAPKADFGFVLNRMPKKDNNIQYNIKESILACTGYVDFLPTMEGVPFNRPFPNFIPAIHLSAVVPCAPNKNLYPLGLTVAAEVFLGQGMWRTSRVLQNLLEILINPATNKPYDLTIPDEKNEALFVLDNILLEPRFMIDIIEGYGHSPMIADVIDPSKATGKTLFKQFFKQEAHVDFELTGAAYQELVGYVNYQSRVLDTRDLNYTFLTKEFGKNMPPEMTQILQDPVLKAKKLSENFVDLRFLTKNIVCSFYPTFFQFADILRKTITISSNLTSKIPAFDLANVPAFNVTSLSGGGGTGFNMNGLSPW